VQRNNYSITSSVMASTLGGPFSQPWAVIENRPARERSSMFSRHASYRESAAVPAEGRHWRI
jgi:hypothetical protein